MQEKIAQIIGSEIGGRGRKKKVNLIVFDKSNELLLFLHQGLKSINKKSLKRDGLSGKDKHKIREVRAPITPTYILLRQSDLVLQFFRQFW